MAGNYVLRVSDLGIDIEHLKTPVFLVDEARLRVNARILQGVIERTGCRIILALKAFSTYATFHVLRETLHGTCASSPDEARLGREAFGKEVHVYGAAYSDEDFRVLLRYADHIDFNSFGQWEYFRPLALQAKKKKNIHFGIRVNPEHSEAPVPMYDPAAPFSRLGVVRSQFRADLLDGISYLHFHTLCQKNADALVRTLQAFEEKFGEFIPKMAYINFGGGHHITREDYDVDLLCQTITTFKSKYDVQVYLEPGEAVALNAGYLVATVLDVIHNGMDIAILDTSAAAHMPDVLEMPYRPHILESGLPHEKPYTYRLGGVSCLAGDVIGDYSFDRPLKRGDKLVFTDMAIYSMVKTNTFNGIRLPDIAIMDSEKGWVRLHKRFGYQDFKRRL
jgi:carboxynorspermidine decarboxylase